MNRREAKRMACALSADLLHADSMQDGWLLERLSHLPKEDQDRVVRADCAVDEHADRDGDGDDDPVENAEDDDTRKIPVMVLTAKGGMRDVFEMSPNVLDYIAKPFDHIDLRERVRHALARRDL